MPARGLTALLRAGLSVLAATAVTSACSAGTHRASRPASLPGGSTSSSSSTLAAAGPSASFPCALNPPTEAITGAFGTASAIGWAGNDQGVVTCLGGSFYPLGRYPHAFGFGIYSGGPTTWVDAGGYLPAQITSFHRGGADVSITEFADEVTIDGHAFVVLYARVAATNTTDGPVTADPQPSHSLIPLADADARLGPHASADHDYVMAVDRFGSQAPWPSTEALVTAGTFDQHFQHMRSYWDGELSKIAEPDVPDPQLVNAYKSGFIYTQIARSGTHENTGVNNYASEFSHDVIGILANLFTQGYYDNAQALLLEARNVVGSQGQYEDGIWTYSWPWAIYLMKTGDLAFVKANFAGPGSAGPPGPSLEDAAHRIAADRTGPNGIIGRTDDIDSNGLWTVDDYEALTGLAAYHYLAQQVGNAREAQWAANEYQSLLAATDNTLAATISHYHLTYIPCSMVEPNTANRCSNPQDANWAAPFLFGRWAWDAPLLGMPVSGPGYQLIDATYAYGFGRLAGILPPDTFGGYPSDYYTTGYNAGYGSWGLASSRYRSQGIASYEFMISNAQGGPYSWWESSTAPAASPWEGSHPGGGQGSSPHAWGIANANKVLLDSLVAQAADGTLLVGRGVPDAWLAAGKAISVTNFPTLRGGRISISIVSTGQSVTLTLTGPVPGPVSFQLPAFVNNIASTSVGTVSESNGAVVFSTSEASGGAVTVNLSRAAG